VEARYILLPTRGFTASEPYSAPATLRFLASLTPTGQTEHPPYLLVLDSIRENGAKLISLPVDAVGAFRREHPGTRIVPEVFYQPARAPRPAVRIAAARKAKGPTGGVVLAVELQPDATPLEAVDVIAFTDFVQGRGAQGRTNRRGQVRLRLPNGTHSIQRLYLFPHAKAWPRVIRNYRIGVTPIGLRAIDPAFADTRAACYARAGEADGSGVTVGVIDTGCGPHPWLRIAGGMNTVFGENESDWSDIDGHGTHVAGLIAGSGPIFRGLAPGVRLRAYRVFGTRDDGASNFAIAKAIDRAVADECDVLNLSLGGGPLDVLTDEAIKDARSRGVLCVIAAGNDGGPVAWPGRHTLAMAVSALGVRGRWPRCAPGRRGAAPVRTPVRRRSVLCCTLLQSRSRDRPCGTGPGHRLDLAPGHTRGDGRHLDGLPGRRWRTCIPPGKTARYPRASTRYGTIRRNRAPCPYK